MTEIHAHDETQRIRGVPRLHSRRRRLLAALLLALAAASVWPLWHATRGRSFSPAHPVRFAEFWPAPQGIRPLTGVVLRSRSSGARLAWADPEGGLHAHQSGRPAFPTLLGVRATPAPLLGWDVNLDGTEDVIFATQDRQLLAIDGLRGTRLSTSEWFAEPIWGSPVLSRHRDGSARIVVHSSAGKLARFDASTLQVAGREAYHAGRTRGSATSHDLNRDGTESVLLGDEAGAVIRFDPHRGETSVLRPDGPAASTRDLVGSSSAVRSPLCAYDYTGDGLLELVYVTLSGSIVVHNVEGTWQAWGMVPAVDSSIASRSPSPVLADLSGDSEPEIIVAHPGGSLYAFQAPGRTGGPLSALWTAKAGPSIQNEVCLADLTGDGVCDVALVADGHLVLVNGRDGREVDRWALAATGSPLIEDLNDDGWLELAVPTDSAWAILATGCPASEDRTWPTWRGDAGRRGFRVIRGAWPDAWWWAVAGLAACALVLWVRS